MFMLLQNTSQIHKGPKGQLTSFYNLPFVQHFDNAHGLIRKAVRI